ncbi:hypothetical protein [Bacillus sp. REN3]|nr:hypothetical protein [Bacillus sp. REN3]
MAVFLKSEAEMKKRPGIASILWLMIQDGWSARRKLARKLKNLTIERVI